MCGFLGCDVHPFNPLLAALPRLLHVRQAFAAGDPLGRLIDFAIAESQERRAGSECVRLRLSELMFVEVVRRYRRGLRAGSRRRPRNRRRARALASARAWLGMADLHAQVATWRSMVKKGLSAFQARTAPGRPSSTTNAASVSASGARLGDAAHGAQIGAQRCGVISTRT